MKEQAMVARLVTVPAGPGKEVGLKGAAFQLP